MTMLQILVLGLFAAVTFANTFLQQPGVELPPELHAALVALNVTMFFAALNLKQFAELGRSTATPDIITPLAPQAAGLELSSATLVAAAKPAPIVARAAVVVASPPPAPPAESPPTA